MVIECAHCQTRFKLADDKLRPEGTKVRCSKCKEIFTVFPPSTDDQPPAPAPPAPAPAAAPMAAEAIDFGNLTMDAPPATDEGDFSFSMESVPDAAPSSSAAMEMEDIATSSGGFDASDLTDVSTSPGTGTGVDLGEFDFDNAPPDQAPQTQPTPVDEANPFGEFDFGEPPADAPATATTANDDNFGFGASPSADFDFGDTPSDPSAFSFGEPAVSEPAVSSQADELNFESMSFGDPVDKTPLPETRPAPPAPMPSPVRDETQREPAPAQESRPSRGHANRAKPLSTPLPKPGRRISIVSILVTLVVILVVAIVGTAVFFFFQPGVFDTRKAIDDFISKSATKVEPGKITLTTQSAVYLSTQQAGDIFVIRGEAINEYKNPRTAIAVKGILYNAQGEILKSQTAYCGNPLSDATLTSLPFNKIEEAMANQFGDSLANLDVAPGKAVPFTIVFRQLPAELSTYTVELAEARPVAQ